MKKHLTLLLIVLQVSIWQLACKKDNSNTTAPINYPAGWLIKTINKSTHVYDSRNRLVEIDRPDRSDSARVQKFTYDNDKVIKIEAANGSYKDLTYTGDKVTTIAEHDAYGSASLTLELKYDAQGRLSQIVNRNSGIYFPYTSDITYNADGLPAQVAVKSSDIPGGYTVTLKNYVGDVDFNPWILTECLAVNYTSPLLFAGITKLPGDVEITPGNGATQTDHYGYNFSDRKIGLILRTTKYSTSPYQILTDFRFSYK